MQKHQKGQKTMKIDKRGIIVCVALLHSSVRNQPCDSIVLGKNKGDDGLRFIGGFVSTEDMSFKSTVIRLVSQTQQAVPQDIKYLASSRTTYTFYPDSEILTVLYAAKTCPDLRILETGTFDTVHVRKFDELKVQDIATLHKPLFDIFQCSYLNQKPITLNT